MIARILENNLLGGYYTEDFLLENANKEINGSLVSHWNTTDVLPNNLKIPLWIGTMWIESITQQEIDAISLIKEEVDDRNDQEILERKGLNLYQKTKNRLIRRNKKGLITKTRCKKVREYLHPIFLLLKTGDIDLANDKAILLPTDANADINTELVLFKSKLAALLTEVNNLI